MFDWFKPPPGTDKKVAESIKRAPGVPIGDWNHAIGIYAPRGFGKSTEAIKVALRLQRAGPAYCVAHDPSFRIPTKDHHGRPWGVRRHQTREQVLAALNSRYPDGIHALGGTHWINGKRITVGPEQVIELALDISDASKLAAAHRAGIRDPTGPTDPRLEGVPAIPVVVILDEMVMVRGASKNRLAPEMADFLISLRHNHVALVWTAQGGNMVHYEMLNQATELYLGRADHEHALKAFEAARVPADIIEDLPTMQKFEFHHVKKD